MRRARAAAWVSRRRRWKRAARYTGLKPPVVRCRAAPYDRRHSSPSNALAIDSVHRLHAQRLEGSVALEELGLPYTVHRGRPGGRRPEDRCLPRAQPQRSHPGHRRPRQRHFVVFQPPAILLYLAEQTGCLMPAGRQRPPLVTQWLMFQMAGVGPMMGQANVLPLLPLEKIQPAIDLLPENECRECLFEVLIGCLPGRVAGRRLPIAVTSPTGAGAHRNLSASTSKYCRTATLAGSR